MKPALRAGTKKFVEVELHSTFLSYVGNILIIVIARKYPLRGYILSVLMHTTTWDRHWGGDETLTKE